MQVYGNALMDSFQVDKKAESVLKKLKNKYDSQSTSEIRFDLSIDHEDGTNEIQKGKLIQEGKKYFLDTRDQTIVSNGDIVWVYLKNNNEVQIDNVYEEDEEELSSLSPRDVLSKYDDGSHIYAITHEGRENNQKITQIEFKPVDEDADYSKMRLTISKNSNEILRMKIFNKDGSRYTIEVKEIFSNKTYSPDVFIFDPSKYPNIYIEDLRID